MSFVTPSVSFFYKITIDRRVPLAAKLVMAGSLSYIIWPFDLIPDNIPFWGYSDDLLVVILGFLFLKLFVPYDLIKEHADLQNHKIKRKFYSLELLQINHDFDVENPSVFSCLNLVLSSIGLLFFSALVAYQACLIHWPIGAKYFWAVGYLLVNN